MNQPAATHEPGEMMSTHASRFTPRVPEGSPRLILQTLVTTLQRRDPGTYEHSKRVTSFSLRLARELSLDRLEMESLALGALLHDIGKIRVPDAILHKPGKLTSAQWSRMRNHPLYGQKILSGIEFLEGASRVAAQHHEKWDGSGYPWGLAGKEIDRNARIFAVADAYDAMTSNRVYRASLTYEAAAAELNRGVGIHFDHKVLEAFCSIPRQEWEETTKALASSSPAQPHGQESGAGCPPLNLPTSFYSKAPSRTPLDRSSLPGSELKPQVEELTLSSRVSRQQLVISNQ